MSYRACFLCLLMLLPGLGSLAAPDEAQRAAAPASTPAPILVLRIDGAIGPVVVDQVQRTLDRAARDKAQLVLLEMNTPGGLDTSMRSIVQAILASATPVAGYVAPPGARAASAGTYILYACHVAAMAPATNLGAATPVAIGLPGTSPDKEPTPLPKDPKAPKSAKDAKDAKDGDDGPRDAMAAKRVQDASAYLRGLAQLRGRDVAWAEQAVRESASLSASEALSRNVIDLVAADRADLLRQLDGRALEAGPSGSPAVKLATAQAPVVLLEPGWRERLLLTLSDPSLALLLMMVGIYGLIFEFMNPGFVAPGVIGGVCLLLALWALQMLPINYTGLALILLGIAFFVAEAFVPSYGALGLGGIAAFVFGALLLFDSDVPGFEVPLPLVAALALTSALFVFVVARMAFKAHARPVVSGLQRLAGTVAEVIEFDAASGEGWALLEGERWRIRAAQPPAIGQQVRVTRVNGLWLEVRPATTSHQEEAASSP